MCEKGHKWARRRFESKKCWKSAVCIYKTIIKKSFQKTRKTPNLSGFHGMHLFLHAFMAPIVGLEPTTLRLTVWCSLISIIFHTSINFQKCLKTRGFWMTYKINNVYYLTYVYRFCSQFCSQNNFRDFKLEPMTIRKIHMCSYIN